MRIYRLSRAPFASELSGYGASLNNHRWNTKGTEVIYCAESRALALAEVAVHLTAATAPADLCMMEIEVPDTVSRKRLTANELPQDWNEFPYVAETQAIGNEFVRGGKHCLLIVPSAVVEGDSNVLINPRHPDFKEIQILKVKDFIIDRRLF